MWSCLVPGKCRNFAMYWKKCAFIVQLQRCAVVASTALLYIGRGNHCALYSCCHCRCDLYREYTVLQHCQSQLLSNRGRQQRVVQNIHCTNEKIEDVLSKTRHWVLYIVHALYKSEENSHRECALLLSEMVIKRIIWANHARICTMHVLYSSMFRFGLFIFNLFICTVNV